MESDKCRSDVDDRERDEPAASMSRDPTTAPPGGSELAT
jgi:hypothetical protein